MAALAPSPNRLAWPRRWADGFWLVVLPLAGGWLGAVQGRDLNWDQLNYHVYVAHAFLHGRLGLDFNAASVVSYVNPLAHLPFYVVAKGVPDSFTAAFLLGMLHGLTLSLLYAAARLVCGAVAGFRVSLSIGMVAIGMSHPVLLAELGSSLAEVVACVPLMAALCLLLVALQEHRPWRFRAAALLAAAALAGAAVALKLAFAPFLPGLAVFALYFGRSVLERCVALAACALVLLAGWWAAGGFWHWGLWQAFGNPFFPFFNTIFQSPDYPILPLANHRFVPQDLWAAINFPWRMMQWHPFVTTERMVVDPRYATIIVLLAAWVVQTVRGRASPLTRAQAALMWCFGLGFVAWAISSGNGRYALPMHLASGLLIGALSLALWPSAKAALRLVGWAALVCLVLLAFMGESAHWERTAHAHKWHDVHLPYGAIASDGLYLTAGYFDRSSLSFLVPLFPHSARFVNVNGYSNPEPAGPGGVRIGRMVAQHQGSLWLLAEGSPAYARQGAQAWANAINLNIEGFGARLVEPDRCMPMLMRYGGVDSPMQVFASACPLVAAPAVDHRQAKRLTDAAFDRLEQTHPRALYPAGETSYFRGAGYCRFYAPQEWYLCEEAGTVSAFRVSPPEQLLRQDLPASQR